MTVLSWLVQIPPLLLATGARKQQHGYRDGPRLVSGLAPGISPVQL